MADITNQVQIRGGGQEADRPFGFHTWEIDVPAGVLTDSGIDTIDLADEFPEGTYLLNGFIAVAEPAVNAAACDLDVAVGVKTLATGVLAGFEDVLGASLETAQVTGVNVAGGSTQLTNWVEAGAVVANTTVGVVRLEITAGGAYSTDTCKFLVSLVAGRVNY